jgi:ribonuclease P protein component
VYNSVARGDELSPVRVGFSIPKKRFRLSVHRHRIRRLMAEAWRLQKQGLYSAIAADKQLQVFLIFANNTMPDQETISQAVKAGMERLIQMQDA